MFVCTTTTAKLVF